MSTDTDHKPESWFWEAGSDDCPHGSQPDYEADPEAWDIWSDQHPGSPQDVRICRDAPAGEACGACSENDNEFVPWSACRVRDRARREHKTAQDPQHRPVTVAVGGLECLERECDEYFTGDGEEIHGKENCSHIHDMEVCEACSQLQAAGDFPPVVAWVDCPQRLAKAGAAA